MKQGNLKVNEPAHRGLKPLHSILILELLKLFTVCKASTL